MPPGRVDARRRSSRAGRVRACAARRRAAAAPCGASDVRSVGKPCSSTTVSPSSGPASSTSKVSPSRVKVVESCGVGGHGPIMSPSARRACQRASQGSLREKPEVGSGLAGTYRGDMPDVTAHLRTGRRWWHLSGTGLFFGGGLRAHLDVAEPAAAHLVLPGHDHRPVRRCRLRARCACWPGCVRTIARVIDLRVTVSGEARHWLLVAAPVFAAVAVVAVTVSNVRSQARTAAVVRLTPLSPLDWALALLLAAAIAAALVALARGLRGMTHRLAEAAGHVLPKTIASAIAVVVVVLASAWVTDSVLFHRGMQAFAGIAAQVNSSQPTDRAAPTSTLRSGGPGSLESYASLGYQGQMFVTSAPTPDADHGRHRARCDRADPGLCRPVARRVGRPRWRTPSSPSSSAPTPSAAACWPSSRRRAPAGWTTGRRSRSSTSATATARSPRCSTPTCRARCR